MSSDLPRSWSIDELAVAVGVPTRTLREYRTLGLIAAPRREGRLGRYDESHRQRLELILRLQQRGYSLAAIRDLCAASASGRSLDDILGGSSAAVIDRPAESYSTDQLIEVVPAMVDPVFRTAAIDAGLLEGGDVNRERWHVRAPALLSLVGDVIGAGAEPLAAIRMAAGLVAGARIQANAIADMVVGQLWSEDASVVATLVSTGRRARLQLTQAVASLVVHEAGMSLRAHATMPGGAGLDELVDQLQVGVVRRSRR
jgi:DNA-binding transcriptional MerR regulator